MQKFAHGTRKDELIGKIISHAKTMLIYSKTQQRQEQKMLEFEHILSQGNAQLNGHACVDWITLGT